MTVLSTALQVFGLLLLALAGFLLATWVGIALLGLGALAFGLVLERQGVNRGPVEID